MDCTRREAISMMGMMATGALTPPAGPFLGPEIPVSAPRLHDDDTAQRERLYQLLGDLPDRDRPVSGRVISTEERDSYILEKLELDLNGIEAVPAFLAKPKDLKGPVPAMLFNHSHGGGYDIGKKEFVDGRHYLQNPPYAKVITDQGWIGLCIDTWVFGERAHTAEMEMFKAMIWQGRVLWGMMVYDSIKAMDYLVTRPEVDAKRIGTVGISMGSTMAWWLAALDPRVKVTVDICCLSDFHTLLRVNGIKNHGIYYFVPNLLKHFTTSDINALIAPRAHLGLAGNQDKLTPAEGLDIIDAELKKVYAAKGAPENWQMLRHEGGHMETPEGREAIIAFLKKNL